MRRVLVALVLAAGTGIAVAAAGDDAPAEPGLSPTATTTIQRRDLVEVVTEDGTLGYADARPLGSRLPGTVTWTPDPGTIVRPGEVLYRVDDEPVVLLDGRRPAWRALDGNHAGRDVRALERNLRALGYGDLRVDQEWSDATTDAVLALQEDLGLPETGTLEFGRVVFLPGARRVGGASGQLFETTSRRREVTVDLDTAQASLAERGARVRVELPTGASRRGRVTAVGATATAADPEAPDAGATIEVTIALDRRGVGFDQAPVIVGFEQARAEDVLAVPVTALLARPGGAYAVEVVDGDERTLVPVEPGLYTTGYVEIEGDVTAGQTVSDAAVR